MPARPSLAEMLRALRTAADLTLEGLAERSGVSVRTLSDIERGKNSAPHIRTVEALALGLGLDDADGDAFRRAARGRRSKVADDSGAAAVAPHRVADFTGREREIGEVLALLESTAAAASVVVLSGPPGVGKTTVALEAMSLVSSRTLVLWVDLDGFSGRPLTPLQVLRRLLRQMPGIGDKVPTELTEAVHMWRSATAEHPPTVLLDNAANESQLRPVLSLDARGRVVVTSRRSLAGLESAHRVTIGPMSPESSVAFLRHVIPSAQRSSGDLRELAQLCDHIPLALRIAGNRIASNPARQTADFLQRLRLQSNRLRMLVAGDLAVESAFELSYNDLEPRTAALFRAVSIVDGATFDGRIAAAIAGTEILDTEDRLDELTDLGLMEARGGNRYRVHDLVRLFASTRLAREVGESGVMQLRATLRSWLLGTLERAGAWFEPGRTPDDVSARGASFPDNITAQAWIRLEEPHWWPAMRAAAAAGDHHLVVDVADSLHWFSELWADWGHWCDFFSLAITSARALNDPRLEAMHLGYLVWSMWVERGDNVEAAEVARRAIAAAELSGDAAQIGWSHFYLGVTLRRSGITEGGTAIVLASLSAFREAGDQDGAAQAMVLMGQFHDQVGDHSAAIHDIQQVIESSTQSESTTLRLVHLITLLSAYQTLPKSFTALGRHSEAIDAATAGVAIAREVGAGSRTASALSTRAIAKIAAGDLEGAATDVDDALGELQTYGDDPFVLAGQTKKHLEALRADIMARTTLG